MPEAVARFQELRDLGLDFIRVAPGSRDMDPSLAVQSLQAIAKDVIPAVDSRPSLASHATQQASRSSERGGGVA